MRVSGDVNVNMQMHAYLFHSIPATSELAPDCRLIHRYPQRILQLHLQLIEVYIWNVVDSIEHELTPIIDNGSENK